MNPARPSAGAILASVADLADPGARTLEFAAGEARFSLLLTRRDGRIAAFENVCPHARFPLERPDGVMLLQEERFLVCAAHGASFCMETGAHAGGPGRGRLTLFPISVEAGLIRAG